MKKIIFDKDGKVLGIASQTPTPRTDLHPMLFPWHWAQCRLSEFYTRPKLLKPQGKLNKGAIQK